jgi:hypothetical protein
MLVPQPFLRKSDVPLEIEAVKNVLLAANPGLVYDLHKGFGNKFWIPIRTPVTRTASSSSKT